MRIRIEVDDRIEENEVIIRCSNLDDEVQSIQRILKELALQKSQLTFYKENTEYYFGLEDVLFFDTEEKVINAHTSDNIYEVKYKLYELEELLPGHFMRVSKSTILNLNHIYSITRNITSASTVEFKNTHKKVYVSRHYYKALKFKLLEKRK